MDQIYKKIQFLYAINTTTTGRAKGHHHINIKRNKMVAPSVQIWQ